MLYLRSFHLPNETEEGKIILPEQRTCFSSFYPFKLFTPKEFEDINFDSRITIFYGGNGSGKTTLLNVIAEKLEAERKQPFEKGEFFQKYVKLCDMKIALKKPEVIKIVTSDDIFDYLFSIRNINHKIDQKREELFEEYLNHKFDGDTTVADYDTLKKIVDSRKKTMSKYVRERLVKKNIVEQSNGESALMYFENEINENSLYILDEPENSLSAESQQKLAKFIEESARFFNCQFIISTHSPFLLSITDAKIYDLDMVPVKAKKWAELENVKAYYQFFKEHEDKFVE